MHPASPDNEERRLLAEYETATQYYSWAVGELSRQRGMLDPGNYRKLFQLAEDAFADMRKSENRPQRVSAIDRSLGSNQRVTCAECARRQAAYREATHAYTRANRDVFNVLTL